MTRIALISDQHFDVSSRWDETLRLSKWMAEDLARRDVDLITLGGDLFERRPVPFETRAAAEWIIDLAELAPVVGVYGNHDVENSLAVMNRLEARHGIHFYDRPALHAVVAGCAVACLPWPQKAQILAAAPEISKVAGEQQAGEALRHVLRGLGAMLQGYNGPKLLLAHAMVRGSRTSVGQPLCGCDFELGLEDLGMVGADAYLLGHIHCPQDWMIGNAPVIYPGSPRRTTYGEVEDKGYALLEFDGPRLVRWERIVTPATPMLLVETRWVDGGFTTIPDARAAVGAEIRFRYEISSDERDAGRSAAADLKRQLLDVGAIEVKVEEEITQTTRSRAPEIVTAKTLGEKLDQLWNVQGWEPGERREPLLTKAAELERESQSSARRSGGIRLRGVTLRNIGPVRNCSIDFEALGDAQIVALTGANGAGKSTTLEAAIPGALYRTTPTRGSLKNLATSRDSMVEARIVSGRPWTIRHLVDGVSGNGESVVLDESDVPAYKSTKVKDFDRWAADNLPSDDELFISTFAAQGTAGFIGLTDGDRKSALLRVLGCSYLEQLAERARKLATAKRNELATIEARIADERGRGLSVDGAEAECLKAREAAEAADRELENARTALEAAEDAAAEAVRLANEYARRRTARQEIETHLTTANSTLADLTARVANNEAVLGDAGKIRAAVAELEQLRPHLERLKALKAAADSDLTLIESEITAKSSPIASIDERIQRAEKRLAGRSEVDRAVAELPAVEEQIKAAEQAVEAAQAVLNGMQQHRLASASDRIVALRNGLIGVTQSDTIQGAWEVAAVAIADDDTSVTDAAEIPAKVESAEKALRAAQGDHSRAKAAAEQLRTKASRANEIVAAQTELEHARVERSAITTALAKLQDSRDAAREAVDQASLAVQGCSARISELEPLAGRSDPLARAEARLAELRPQLDEARARVADLQKALDAQPEPPEDPIAQDTTTEKQRVSTAERGARDAHAAVAVSEKALADATARNVRLEEMISSKGTIEADLADWSRLGEDLGKDGLQALMIDAAGPEITARTNDLLHTCHGPRFSALVNTQPLSADGKRQLEGCEIMVTDTQKGYIGEARTFSGGEKVILGEALSLALTQIGCQRVGVDRPTLVRDESGAGLDFANSRAYVAMLRRAATQIGADRVLIVSHSQDVVDLVDARVEIGTKAEASNGR